jgi:hypothetical protein
MDNDPLIDDFIGDHNNAIKIIVDGFADVLLLIDHLQHLSDAVDNTLHQEIVLLLIADQTDLQLVDHLEQHRVVAKGEDLV